MAPLGQPSPPLPSSVALRRTRVLPSTTHTRTAHVHITNTHTTHTTHSHTTQTHKTHTHASHTHSHNSRSPNQCDRPRVHPALFFAAGHEAARSVADIQPEQGWAVWPYNLCSCGFDQVQIRICLPKRKTLQCRTPVLGNFWSNCSGSPCKGWFVNSCRTFAPGQVHKAFEFVLVL